MPSKFDWTDGGAQSFTTDLHVQEQVPTKARSLYPQRSLDQSVLEVVVIGSGIPELDVVIRHDADHAGLVAFQDAARRGISITYTPDTGTPGTTHTVKAVQVGEIALEAEGRQNLFTLSLRLAKLAGGTLGPDL